MRVLLKISGEALKGKKEFGIDSDLVSDISLKIKEIYDEKNEIVIVIGGGNIYRGTNLINSGLNPSDSHNLSMLSTVFNGVILKNFLEKIGLKSIVMDPLGINFLEKYNKDKAKKLLNKKNIIICVGGTSNPYFTTDTAGVLRSLELDCNIMIKATKVDGVFDKDPEKFNNAKLIKKINYDEIITKDLRVMDMTAIALAKENKLILKVVNLFKKGAILKAINGKDEGTTIS